MLGADDEFAAYTGAECVPWCGHWSGEDFSVAGNMLAGPQVVSETVRVLRERADLELPRRLIAALKAGEKVGGDKRGKQSAALVIYGDDEQSELDLRVDDHVEPIARAGAAGIGEPRESGRISAPSCRRGRTRPASTIAP